MVVLDQVSEMCRVERDKCSGCHFELEPKLASAKSRIVLAVNLILKYHPFSRHYQGSIGFNISQCRDVFLDIHLQQG